MAFISTGIRLHLKNWKRSTLCSILTRAYKICSTKELLEEELRLIEISRCPKWIPSSGATLNNGQHGTVALML